MNQRQKYMKRLEEVKRVISDLCLKKEYNDDDMKLYVEMNREFHNICFHLRRLKGKI